MRAPDVICFDFDGVIVDTENVHVAAWERTFHAMGWDLPLEFASRCAEMDDRELLADVFQKMGVEGDIEGWAFRKHQLALEMMREEPRLYAGVEELVCWLQGRCRLAIVSTARREVIDAVLAPKRLSELFELVVSRESVTKPKPDPEAYLIALARLGVDREKVLAVEDSGPGILSARSAGIECLAIGHRMPYGEWCQSSRFLADFTRMDRTREALGFALEENPWKAD